MKKFTRMMVLLGLLIGMSVSAQLIPNAGFEIWEPGLSGGQQPQGWMAIMNSAAIANVVEVDGYGGGSAVQLIAVEIPTIGFVSPLLMSESFEVDQRYGMLDGFFKSAPQGNDTLYIMVSLYKGDGDVVGIGIYTIEQSVPDFTEFHANIYYISDDIPEHGIITFTSGKLDGTATQGSTFTLDELSLSGSASVNELNSIFAGIGVAYPCPASNEVNIPFELTEPDEMEIVVFDVAGNLVHKNSKQYYGVGNHTVSVQTSGLVAGTYTYSIIPSDGKNVTRKFMVK